MGIHTGDSITVAPAMTLSDTTYQRMRDMAIKMMKSIGDCIKKEKECQIYRKRVKNWKTDCN